MDEHEINILNQTFYLAVRTDDWSEKEKLFTADVTFHMSMTGDQQGMEMVEQAFLTKLPHPRKVKQNIENVVLHIQEEHAIQNFHMIMFHCINQDEFHYVQYGVSFVLQYQKVAQSWKIISVVCDLCWIEGNSYWLNNWNLIDFSMPKNNHQLIPNTNHAWNIIVEKEDYEQIKEILYGYGWAIDTEDYGLLKQIAINDFCVDDGYHGIAFHGLKDWICFLQKLNQKEPCLHHTYQITSIIFDQNQGKATMSRLEPNRIGSKVIGKDTWKMDWLTLDYDINLTKIHGRWYLKEVKFHKNMRAEMSKGYFAYDV